MNILPIAYNTFREAIRDKILYVILMFSIVMICSSIIMSFLSVGQGERVIIARDGRKSGGKRSKTYRGHDRGYQGDQPGSLSQWHGQALQSV